MTDVIISFLVGSICVQLTFMNWTLQRIADALEKVEKRGESDGKV